jgi:DNA-binding phage protein
MIDTKKLAAAMQNRGLDSFRLSLAARVPQPTIYRTLKGRTIPQTPTLFRICQALGLRIEDVFISDEKLAA